MDLKSLSQIDINDLKNINFAKYVDAIKSRPDILISLGVSLLTVIFVIHSLSSNKIQEGRFKKSIAEAQEKLKAVKENKIVLEEYTAYTENFPDSLSSDNLINKLAEYASSSNVRIQTFSPASDKKFDNWVLTTIKVNISATEYKSIVDFVKAIEAAPYSLRIETWSGGLGRGKQRGRSKPTSAENEINSNVEIGSIRLINE